jgi:hypothetical protein
MSEAIQKNNLAQNIFLAMTSGVIYYISIMSYGLGITDDSINYLSAASSFPSLVKIDGTPYTEWPPLYPSILSIYKFTGMNILNFAALLHGLIFCLCIVIFNTMTKPYFKSQYIYWTFIICILFSTPLLQSFIFLWSEGIFILLILITIYYLSSYIEKPSIANLILLIMFSMLMCMQRKSGIIFTGAFTIILYKYKPETKSGLLKMLIYFIVSAAPFIWWTYRRYLISGSPTSGASLQPGRIWENLGQSADVLSSWLLPDEIPLILRFIILIAGIMLMIFIFRRYPIYNQSNDKKMISFSFITLVIYISSLCIIFLYLKADEPIDDRLLSPVYLVSIFLIFISIDRLLFFVQLNHLLRKTILASVILLPLYFILRTSFHIRRWNEYGTGGYNTKVWAENTVVKTLMPVKSQNIVSNNIYVLSYYLNFKNRSASRIVDSRAGISGSHFIIAYFSRQLSHVSANFNIQEDLTKGKVLYQGKEGIMIQE